MGKKFQQIDLIGLYMQSTFVSNLPHNSQDMVTTQPSPPIRQIRSRRRTASSRLYQGQLALENLLRRHISCILVSKGLILRHVAQDLCIPWTQLYR